MRNIFFILIVGAIFSAFAQPIPRSSWTKINQGELANINGSYPRVASFSNGDYVVVYTVAPPAGGGKITQIMAKIFFKDGSVKTDEFQLSTPLGPNHSPNVLVLKGDM